MTIAEIVKELAPQDIGQRSLRPLFREFPMMPLVSISNAQRAPLSWANWHGTVYHGSPTSLYALGRGQGSYLAFMGRISPEKGLEYAIEIARRAGMPLRIAAKKSTKRTCNTTRPRSNAC